MASSPGMGKTRGRKLCKIGVGVRVSESLEDYCIKLLTLISKDLVGSKSEAW